MYTTMTANNFYQKNQFIVMSFSNQNYFSVNKEKIHDLPNFEREIAIFEKFNFTSLDKFVKFDFTKKVGFTELKKFS